MIMLHFNCVLLFNQSIDENLIIVFARCLESLVKCRRFWIVKTYWYSLMERFIHFSYFPAVVNPLTLFVRVELIQLN